MRLSCVLALSLGFILLQCQSVAAQTTVDLRLDGDAARKSADAELNVAYKQLMAALTEEQKNLLKPAQRAWIEYRDACAASEGAVYAGGTLEAVTAVKAAADLTSEQAGLLKALGASPGATTAVSDSALSAADADLNAVYSALKTIGGPDESVKVAQKAWLKYRDLFAKVAAATKKGGDPKENERAAIVELTALRAARLKLLFPEGYPAGGAENVKPGEQVTSQTAPQKMAGQASASTDSGLCGAVASGNVVAVKQALAKGVDWQESCGEQLGFPLHVAVNSGNTEIVQLLLKSGAPVNQADPSFGTSPLHVAAGSGDAKLVQLLLSNGAGINAGDEQGDTPLDIAQANGKSEVVKLLQQKGGTAGGLGVDPPTEPKMAEHAPSLSPSPQTGSDSAVATSPGTPSDGRPMIKGFYAGMPFRQAVERMRELDLIAKSDLQPDGSLNWKRIVQKDAKGVQFAEGTQGLMLLWKLVADGEGRLALMYWRGEVTKVLMKAGDMGTDEFLKTFVEAYHIDKMEPFEAPTDLVSQALGAQTTQVGWQKVERKAGWRLAVHEDRSMVYELVTKASESSFN